MINDNQNNCRQCRTTNPDVPIKNSPLLLDLGHRSCFPRPVFLGRWRNDAVDVLHGLCDTGSWRHWSQCWQPLGEWLFHHQSLGWLMCHDWLIVNSHVNTNQFHQYYRCLQSYQESRGLLYVSNFLTSMSSKKVCKERPRGCPTDRISFVPAATIPKLQSLDVEFPKAGTI